jgi:hypothetical protein
MEEEMTVEGKEGKRSKPNLLSVLLLSSPYGVLEGAATLVEHV